MTIELTAQLCPWTDRLGEFDTADLSFTVRCDELIADLVSACVKRIEKVTTFQGKRTTLDIRSPWKIKKTKGSETNTKKRAYRYGIYWKKRIGTFQVTWSVRRDRTRDQCQCRGWARERKSKISNRETVPRRKKIGMQPASLKQKEVANKLGTQPASLKQKEVVWANWVCSLDLWSRRKSRQKLGMQPASLKQKKVAKKGAIKLGMQPASLKQKEVAKKMGMQPRTEKQLKSSREPASSKQKEAVAASNRRRRKM